MAKVELLEKERDAVNFIEDGESQEEELSEAASLSEDLEDGEQPKESDELSELEGL